VSERRSKEFVGDKGWGERLRYWRGWDGMGGAAGRFGPLRG